MSSTFEEEKKRAGEGEQGKSPEKTPQELEAENLKAQRDGQAAAALVDGEEKEEYIPYAEAQEENNRAVSAQEQGSLEALKGKIDALGLTPEKIEEIKTVKKVKESLRILRRDNLMYEDIIPEQLDDKSLAQAIENLLLQEDKQNKSATTFNEGELFSAAHEAEQSALKTNALRTKLETIRQEAQQLSESAIATIAAAENIISEIRAAHVEASNGFFKALKDRGFSDVQLDHQESDTQYMRGLQELSRQV